MYSDPEIVISKRSYVKVYIDGERERFYNGKRLGIKCNPNKSRTPEAKARELERLRYHLKQKLEKGWRPGQPVKKAQKPDNVAKTVKDAWTEMYNSKLSDSYLREVEYTKDEFLSWLSISGIRLITELQTAHIKNFLSAYSHSSSLYMNRKRNLSALLKRADYKVQDVPSKKSAAKLNRPFHQEQMREVLYTLYSQHSNLYLCALMMYGCLLRPHIEIRQLKRGDFSEYLDTISLSGGENKSKRVRTVRVPMYVKEVLLQREIDKLPEWANIFTGNIDNYQYYYFNTAWERIKEKLLEKEVITTEYTLYSFRHTAACNIYLKTKDPWKVQRALGHGSLTTTLTYLRSLGLMVNIEDSDLPDAI